MLLTEHEVQQAIEQAKTNFPHFSDWQYESEEDEDDFGFTFILWGQLTFDPEGMMPRRFFITLYRHQENWHGSLTIGQYNYLWTSADVGDAHLLVTDACQTLEAAITALKAEMAKLCRTFSIV